MHVEKPVLDTNYKTLDLWIKWTRINKLRRHTRARAGIACWLERGTRDREIASSNPGRSGWGIFFSRVNFVCWLSFGVRSTPVLPQWHVRDPGHSAKSAGGRLHLNTHTVGVGWLCRCPGIVWEPLKKNKKKRAHTQLVREHSITVVSARWVTMDWSWHKEWN